MKKSEVEGVPQEKLDRLWGHLMKAEKLGKQRLRKKPKWDDTACPIINFASSKFEFAYFRLSVYEITDSEWYCRLSNKTRRAITKWVIQKIKERDDGGK